ncbi:ABC transporter permease [Rhodovarius crocodyli]|uniref:ABC transporter permease n=2 Tax=Rhodovarius crocodyli TaxID=1979269 RepID=A0A437M3F1_9PROT|nr:ABC transporter permease [Rhodovarius crocodyli]
MSLGVPVDGLPPYRIPLLAGEGMGEAEAWSVLTEDGHFLWALWRSLWLAGVSALGCVALSYPMALGLLRVPPRRRMAVLGLVLLPFTVGFVLRMAGWVGLLRDSGLVNQALIGLGLITDPLPMLYSEGAMLAGMIHGYLPFAFMPVLAALSARDPALEQAAADLGAGRLTIFRTVTLPVTARAGLAGFLLVFIPAAGEFVIPELLGPPEALLAGRAIWQEFFSSRDWPLAAAASMALLGVLILPILLWQRAPR